MFVGIEGVQMTKPWKGDGDVEVPPSKVDKMSAVRNSIWNMVNWYSKGIV